MDEALTPARDIKSQSLSAHQAPLTALDFTEPYGMLVTAGADDVVRVWDMCDGDEIGQLRGHEGTVKCVQIEDTLCLTGGADGAVRMWDLRMAEEYEESLKRDEENRRRTADGLDAHEHHHDLERKVSISAGSARATAGEDDASTSTSPCIRALEGHSKAVTALYYESGTLVTGSSDKTIRQWDAETGQCVLTMDILWAISNPPAASMIASSSAAEPRPPTISPPLSPVRPGLLGRASSSFRSPTGARRSHSIDPFDSPYPDMSAFGGGGGAVASPGASLYGLPGAGLLSSATTGTFAVPTPPYSDGSWEMYQDFVGGVQFWGYALASGSGDGGVRMWDSELQLAITLSSLSLTSSWRCVSFSAHGSSPSNAHRSHRTRHLPSIRRDPYRFRVFGQDAKNLGSSNGWCGGRDVEVRISCDGITI